ncbi:MAG TPA: RDD family protein [Candidatus Binatia bacterium]
MKCQNCEALVLASDEYCAKCGAKLLHRRVFPSAPKREEFTLTPEEPSAEFETQTEHDDWRIESPPEFAATPQRIEWPSEPIVDVRWGGFFRRMGACLIDFVVIILLFALMGLMAYIGYKVGLAAHDRWISWSNAAPLMTYLTFAWVGLTTAYFVVFHGMEGQTIGKWLLGLRVVSAGQTPLTYRRALLRWIGTVGFGFVSLGLSFLWILWQREKRGWHDFLARTWVIRD